MSDLGGGSEGHGGVPAGGQGYFGSAGRGRDLAYDLKRARGPRRPRGSKRWWQFWRRGERSFLLWTVRSLTDRPTLGGPGPVGPVHHWVSTTSNPRASARASQSFTSRLMPSATRSWGRSSLGCGNETSLGQDHESPSSLARDHGLTALERDRDGAALVGAPHLSTGGGERLQRGRAPDGRRCSHPRSPPRRCARTAWKNSGTDVAAP